MSELATLARPYAIAAFKTAKHTGSLAKWSEWLAFMSTALNDQELVKLISSPKIGKSQLSSLLISIYETEISSEYSNFLKLLVENGRLKLIAKIAELFETYKADEEGYVDVDVKTAYSFSKEAKQRFALSLEKSLGKKVNMNVTVDTSLIGGVLVRAGDRVIDVSIRGQLQQLAKKL